MPLIRVTLKALLFTIAAAKDFDYDIDPSGIPDWKYIDDADNAADAVAKFNSARDYPIVYFHVESEWSDGSRTRVPVFGGPEEKLVDGRWVQV